MEVNTQISSLTNARLRATALKRKRHLADIYREALEEYAWTYRADLEVVLHEPLHQPSAKV